MYITVSGDTKGRVGESNGNKIIGQQDDLANDNGTRCEHNYESNTR